MGTSTQRTRCIMILISVWKKCARLETPACTTRVSASREKHSNPLVMSRMRLPMRRFVRTVPPQLMNRRIALPRWDPPRTKPGICSGSWLNPPSISRIHLLPAASASRYPRKYASTTQPFSGAQTSTTRGSRAAYSETRSRVWSRLARSTTQKTRSLASSWAVTRSRSDATPSCSFARGMTTAIRTGSAGAAATRPATTIVSYPPGLTRARRHFSTSFADVRTPRQSDRYAPASKRPSPADGRGPLCSAATPPRAASRLLDRPGVAGREELLEAHLALRRLRLADDLPRHLVGRGLPNVAEDADRRQEARLLDEVREHERHHQVRARHVVDEDVRLRHAVLADRDDLELGRLRVEADPLLVVLSEEERLAVLHAELRVRLRRLLGDEGVGAVVEHRAVLEDLDEHAALVLGRDLEDAAHVRPLDVDRASDERRAGAERERGRVERVVRGAVRRRLRLLVELGGRGDLALREPVDAVVEHQELQVQVAPHRVVEVVVADGERVAVAGDDPHHQLGPGDLDARREGRGAAVERVHPVVVHVVREARGAADAGDEDDVLALHPDVRERPLHLVDDREVAAAGAPARIDARLEVLLRVDREGGSGLAVRAHVLCRPFGFA